MDLQNLISLALTFAIIFGLNYMLYKRYKRIKNKDLMNKRAAEIADHHQKVALKNKQEAQQKQKQQDDWNAFRNEMIFAKNRYKDSQEIINSISKNHSQEELMFIIGHEFFFQFEESLKKQWFGCGTEGHHLVTNNIAYMVETQIKYLEHHTLFDDNNLLQDFFDQRPSQNKDFLDHVASKVY